MKIHVGQIIICIPCRNWREKGNSLVLGKDYLIILPEKISLPCPCFPSSIGISLENRGDTPTKNKGEL